MRTTYNAGYHLPVNARTVLDSKRAQVVLDNLLKSLSTTSSKESSGGKQKVRT